MQNISNLLERFKKIKIPNETVRKEILEIIKYTTGADVDFKNISVKEGIVYIKLAGAAKSEIFLNKKKILERIKSEKITDIK